MTVINMEQVLKALERQGWKVSRTKQLHKAVPPEPDRPIVHFSALTSSNRDVNNTLARLRRSGFRWPEESVKSALVFADAELAFADGRLADKEATVPAERAEERVERLFRELKEAKGYQALAEEHMAERSREMEIALEQFEAAKRELEGAMAKLRAAKAAFDEAFSASAPGAS